MRARFVRVATVLLAGLTIPLVAATPALAWLDDGESPTHTGWPFIVGIYFVIPIAFFFLLAALTYAPSLRRRPRYRPSRDWKAEAVWFNGPAEPERALAAAVPSDVKGGGASASW